MIFRIDFGNVPTMWYYCFNFISTVQHNVHVLTFIYHIFVLYRSGVVMVSVLASIAVDHGSEPRAGKNKDYKIVTFKIGT